ncbi:MAG: DoxX family protein [Fimbriimonadaceae bacterium]
MSTETTTFGQTGASATPARTASKTGHRLGIVITVLFAIFMAMDVAMHLANPPQVVEATQKLGFPASLAFTFGVVQLVCLILYVVPRTAILGAILEAAYLGGATAAQIRVGGPFFFSVAMGVLAWSGLYLRDERLRMMIPLRNS